MNRNATYLVIFAVMLGVGIAGSCIAVPGTHWVGEEVITYQKAIIFDGDGNEDGYAMVPSGEETNWYYTPSTWHACLCTILIVMAFLGGFGMVYNIARLRGWDMDN